MLVIPAAGFGPWAGGAALPQGQTTGRGSAPSSNAGGPQGQGASQSSGRSTAPGQRPQPSAEQYLGAWDWWKDEAVKKQLKLTDMQVRQITGIFERRVREVTPFYDEYRKQMAQLDRMTEERTVDEAAYAVQVSRAESLRSKLNETRAVMLYTIYRRLEPWQYQELRKVWEQRRNGRGGRTGAPPARQW